MKYIVANWKSNKTQAEAAHWFEESQFSLSKKNSLTVIIAPPFPFLKVVPQSFLLAVQDISPFPAGSYTGAVSARNLVDFNVSYAIVGHSERRRYFHETDQDVARKVEQSLENNITPIVCIDTQYLASQAQAIKSDYLSQCIVAYEPLAAIGSGDAEDPEQVLEVADRVKEVFGEVPVLYGGSVTSQEVQEYFAICDGILVGGASLDANEFSQLVLRAASVSE